MAPTSAMHWIVLITVLTVIFASTIAINTTELNEQNKHINPKKFCEKTQSKDRECKDFNTLYLRFFMSLFCIIAWGALVRTLLKATGLCIPYTVILMLTGLLIGMGAHIDEKQWSNGCTEWTTYTQIARMPPEIILNVFLPVLIFESAFSMNPHVFIRSAAQIIVVAVPGMIMTTVITALVCKHFLKPYEWSLAEASLFGAIVSATDPVSVVALLKELGTSESLSTMIEGESLINDGIAIVMFKILLSIVTSTEAESLEYTILTEIVKIAILGPLLGWFIAKIAIKFVSVIFNDATIEITVTLVAAYLTYYIGENIANVSGVMSVVVLGLVMSAERTSISPEVEKLVQSFWEMLAYLANTVLFVIVGIVITETAVNSFHILDLGYLLFVYVAILVIRLFMLLVLSPILSRMGYGLPWQNMILMMWGGLRGAISICLALQIYTNEKMCQTSPRIGPRYLLLAAGIVLLTLVVNGTTTKAMLDCLKVTQLSIGRIQDMNNAYKQIMATQARTIAVLKNDRFLADAKWMLVEKYTHIDNPYAKKKTAQKLEKMDRPHVLEKPYAKLEIDTVKPANPNQPTRQEFRNMTEEARLRCLKALKVSFWRQYENGVLTEVAVQILRNAASAAEDKALCIIHAKDLNRYWVLHGIFPWLHSRLTEQFIQEETLPPMPRSSIRRWCWHIITHDAFDYFIIIVIIVNMAPAIWEMYLIATQEESLQNGTAQSWAFFGVNAGFLFIYTVEAILKVAGGGLRYYFCTVKWNYFDLILLILSYFDFILSLLINFRLVAFPRQITQGLRFIRIIRILRGFRLLRPMFPIVIKAVNRRMNEQLFLGYDVGKGFVTALDDVIKFLPQIVTHPKILRKLKEALETERLQTVKEMGMLQKSHPGIAVAVKTRHASRAVLNQMRAALLELKEDGLIDEKENATLVILLEEKMKRLWNSPSSLPSVPPLALLENLPWVVGREDIMIYVKDHAISKVFAEGEIISEAGDEPDGIYVIVTGLVQLHYIPTQEIIKNFSNHGVIPNVDLFLDLSFKHEQTDYFSTGAVFGEMSVLTGEKRCVQLMCASAVVAYHLPQEPMRKALQMFNDPLDSLESRLWRSYGIRLASALFPSQSAYASWTLDKIRMHLDRSVVPIGERFHTMAVPEYISDVVVIRGQVMNYHTRDVYKAPCLIPRSCSKFTPVEGGMVQPRVLIVAHEEFDHDEEAHSVESLHKQGVSNTSIDLPTQVGIVNAGVTSEILYFFRSPQTTREADTYFDTTMRKKMEFVRRSRWDGNI